LEPGPVQFSGGHLEDGPLGVINRGLELAAVQPKKGRHRGMASPLVAINERMILDERKPEGGCLRGKARVEIVASECLAGLCDSRLQGCEIAKEGFLATLFHYQPVEEQNLSQAEVSHYRRRS
jgi:hypothetical protein